jgi:hypothetical protein
MGERHAKKSAGRHSLSFVFVHMDDGRKQSPLLLQPESWWVLCRKWLHYTSIQWRWDVERRIARIFHRRWGG